MLPLLYRVNALDAELFVRVELRQLLDTLDCDSETEEPAPEDGIGRPERVEFGEPLRPVRVELGETLRSEFGQRSALLVLATVLPKGVP